MDLILKMLFMIFNTIYRNNLYHIIVTQLQKNLVDHLEALSTSYLIKTVRNENRNNDRGQYRNYTTKENL